MALYVLEHPARAPWLHGCAAARRLMQQLQVLLTTGVYGKYKIRLYLCNLLSV